MTKRMPKKKAGFKRSMDQRYEDFVEAFLSNGGDLTKSALAAGYSKGGAHKAGYRLSRNVQVLSMLDKRRTVVFDNLQITTERILKERARLAFFDVRKLFDKDGRPIAVHLLDDDTAAVVAGIDVEDLFDGSGKMKERIGTVRKYKLADKNASLTSLEKQRGMYAADNAQQTPDLPEGTHDLIESARAIAFTLARAAKLLDKQK